MDLRTVFEGLLLFANTSVGDASFLCLGLHELSSDVTSNCIEIRLNFLLIRHGKNLQSVTALLICEAQVAFRAQL